MQKLLTTLNPEAAVFNPSLVETHVQNLSSQNDTNGSQDHNIKVNLQKLETPLFMNRTYQGYLSSVILKVL